MSINLSALQKQRRDTAANWTAENPTLLAGEIGLESDTGYWKVGDGSTAWTSLAYVTGLGAEIPVSRLADGTARQLLQTAANGNDVEWTSNVDVPGTLDVTGAATFDAAVTIQGDLTVNGTTTTIDTQNLIVEDKNVIIGNVTTPTDVTADGGGITLKGTTDKTINWVDATDAWTLSEHVNIASGKEYRIDGTKVLDATSLGSGVLITSANITDGTIVNGDINASAAIAGTKISPDFGSQNVTTTGTSTAASFIPTSSTAPTNGVYLPAANSVAISTNSTGRLFIDSSGNVGVGTSPSQRLHVVGGATTNPSILLAETGGSSLQIISGASDSFIGTNGSTPLRFGTAFTERMRLDSSGRLGIGTTTPSEALTVVGAVQLGGDTTVAHRTKIYEWFGLVIDAGENTRPIRFNVAYSERARIDTSGRLLVGTSSHTASTRASFTGHSSSGTGEGIAFFQRGSAASSGNRLGDLRFSDNSDISFAGIAAEADGTVTGSSKPGRLLFSTTADGASSPTERMRITQGGTILIGKTANDQGNAGMQLIAGGRASFATDGSECIYVNRNTNDGNLIELAQAGTIEGTISVSGTTVSYNGAHLSRWSQLPSGAEREEILRGSVLSNIDEMCEWGDEENEQLNRMKVSDVEGDKNVSGVFQAWDDDDDTYTNDFYCAMTGDFIIRIGAGVTVERGDLLMSAGDGTAKPQADDLVRSCTIAKVTSTNVSCTYDDGSYCVPCVLMAC